MKMEGRILLNYANLNDVEFEHICQDIMERKLNITLRRFAPGRDGGIDLAGMFIKDDIIIQVKHYIDSPVSQLITALKKEVPKVEKINPKQYYVCCSKLLTPKKIDEIYSMFSRYMNSRANIVTLAEIEDFLVLPENIDILKKHYKLWISSTNILENIFSNNIFIDCESLLANIEEEEKLFVQTSAYNKALECLEYNRCLFITGSPGVGKTITSKMLILYFAAKGYHVKYTTDGNNLTDLKKSLLQVPDVKEIILLDDCLGQAYFNMGETQGRELLSIIRHVKLHKNKILLLNSRVTIFQEAKERTPDLIKSLEAKEYKVYIIDMDLMPKIEKARILYNHLFFNKIEKSYIEEIKKEKRYFNIINHPNYSPRIIEFVTNLNRVSEVPVTEYYSFIVNNLDNPNAIWEDEYVRRLTYIDRILLTTLYSISDTAVPYKFVKECFDYRILKIPNIDFTVNNFKNSILHLQKSFIKIVDVKGTRMISMINPSVNDFIASFLAENNIEKNNLILYSCSVIQKRRMMDDILFVESMSKAFADKTVLKYIFIDSSQKNSYITYYVAKNKITDKDYEQYIISFLEDLHDVYIGKIKISDATDIIQDLLQPELLDFYNLKSFFFDPLKLITFLDGFELEDLVKVLTCFDFLYRSDLKKIYISICKDALEEAISWYCIGVNADEFDLDISSIISNCTSYYEDEGDIDTDEAERIVYDEIVNKLIDEIYGFISELPTEIQPEDTFIDNLTFSIDGCQEWISDYIEAHQYDERDYHMDNNEDIAEIDAIFNR